MTANGYGASAGAGGGVVTGSGMRQRWWLHTTMNVLNTAELYTLKWLK